MKLFSERQGLTKPTDVIIKGYMTLEIQNAICNCFDKLRARLDDRYLLIEKAIWTNFFDKRITLFPESFRVATNYIEDEKVEWYKNLI